MLRNPNFWQLEKDAPLLSRNHGFLKHDDNTSIFERVAKWPAMVGVEAAPTVAPTDTIATAIKRMQESKVHSGGFGLCEGLTSFCLLSSGARFVFVL